MMMIINGFLFILLCFHLEAFSSSLFFILFKLKKQPDLTQLNLIMTLLLLFFFQLLTDKNNYVVESCEIQLVSSSSLFDNNNNNYYYNIVVSSPPPPYQQHHHFHHQLNSRSISVERHIELFVVIDLSMYEYHINQNQNGHSLSSQFMLEHYIHTLISSVSFIFVYFLFFNLLNFYICL